MTCHVEIRRAELGDLEAITAIYNEAIETLTATFDTEPKDLKERRAWMEQHDERHPVLVACMNGTVVAWSSLSRWSERQAYVDTVETTTYVRTGYRGHGIGRSLKEAVLQTAKSLGFHTVIARVAEESLASLHLNESMGFRRVGTLKQVGRKFGRLLDVHLLQLMLDDFPNEPPEISSNPTSS